MMFQRSRSRKKGCQTRLFPFGRCWAVLLVLIAFSVNATASTVSLAGTDQLNIAPGLRYLEDARQGLTLADVRAIPDSNWQQNTATTFNAGFSESSFWFRFDIEHSDVTANEWLLEIANPLLDHVNVYFIRDERILPPLSTGDSQPFHTRPIQHRHFLVKLPRLGESEKLSVFIQTNTSGAMQLPLRLWQTDAFIEAEQDALMWQWMFYGIMLAMAVVNLFVFVATRDMTYLNYVGLVMSLVFFQASLHGFSYQLLWPESLWWQDRSVAFFIACSSAFAVFFAISFLKLKQQAKRYYYPFALFAIVSTCGIAFSLMLPYALALRFSVGAITIATPFCMVIGALLWKNGFVPARFYLLAWSMLMFSNFVLVASKSGYLPVNLFTENAQQIGAVLQAVLLALALSDQIEQLHIEQLTAQEAILRHERESREAQERANSMLEQRVDERTRELADVVRKLAEANDRLNRMSILDELSGLHNRRYFNQKYEADFKAAYREQNPIAVLMFDIDHFKQINDQFGHLVGDRCIAHVAGIIRDCVTRPADTVARYGGEEFVVVLCNTPLEGAVHVAEEIRRKVADAPFLWRNDVLPLSISVGVGVTIPEQYNAMMTLLDEADTALYESKQQGRNRVSVGRRTAGNPGGRQPGGRIA
jgi:diguanylate cyclase (GGDEF)-like protein